MTRSRILPRPYRVSRLSDQQELPTVRDYHLGCTMLRLLQQGFPHFWQEHCHQRLLTDQSLYGAVQAFLSLVDRHWFAIEELDCFDRSLTQAPAAAFDQLVPEPLAQLRDEWGGILNPQPIYVGVGINDILEEHLEADLLTLLLWRLLDNTTWSLGVGDAIAPLLANASDAAASAGSLILAQEPLPADTRMQELCAVLDRWQRTPALGLLLAYAIGQTGNVFADASLYDLYAGYDGTDRWEWSDAAFIAREQHTAIQIALAYSAWSDVVDQAPAIHIPTITALLHATAAGSISCPAPVPPWGCLAGVLEEHATGRAARALPVPAAFAVRAPRP